MGLKHAPLHVHVWLRSLRFDIATLARHTGACRLMLAVSMADVMGRCQTCCDKSFVVVNNSYRHVSTPVARMCIRKGGCIDSMKF